MTVVLICFFPCGNQGQTFCTVKRKITKMSWSSQIWQLLQIRLLFSHASTGSGLTILLAPRERGGQNTQQNSYKPHSPSGNLLRCSYLNRQELQRRVNGDQPCKSILPMMMNESKMSGGSWSKLTSIRTQFAIHLQRINKFDI